MRQVFSLVPTDMSPMWMLWVAIPLLIIFSLLHVVISRQPDRIRLTVTEEGLEVTGGWYKRFIGLDKLNVDGAQPLDLGQAEGYRLKWRTNGIGMPGYKAGWFRLRNGEKAVVFITDQRQVVYVPTTEGYAVMASVADARGVIGALRQAKAAGR
jgi:hypothetical protein